MPDLNQYINRIKNGLKKRGIYRRTIIKPSFFLAKTIERARIRKFHNIHNSSERCFIIGNGPSINEMDLTLLKNEFTFVTNWFLLHKQYRDIRPDYYCISDSRVFCNKDAVSTLKNNINITGSSPKKFFPLSSRKIINNMEPLGGKTAWYLDYVLYPIWESREVSLEIHNKVYTGDTIIIDFCLPIAYYMGFKEIYLIGCDCSLGDQGSENKDQKHFYKESGHKSKQQSNRYLKEEWLKNVLISYETIKIIFESNGRKIYNAGYGGKLEVFDRVDYDSFFYRLSTKDKTVQFK